MPYFTRLSVTLIVINKYQPMDNEVISSMATAAIHAHPPSIADKAHLVPIYATSSFVFDSAEDGMKRFKGEEKGYIYSRFSNPTTEAAADIIAGLETFGLKDNNNQPLKAAALLTASGQGAMAALFFSTVSAGDTIISGNSLYGGTHEFLASFLPQFGVKTRFIDMRKLDLLEDVLQEDNTIKLIHLETPANPGMECTDLTAICKLAQKYGQLVSVDNTFATPYLQQPFAFGVDYIFHSTTKFLNGHGSAIGGVLIGRDVTAMKTKVFKTYKLLGANSNPFDAFLLMQGIKTLAARMDVHCNNAEQVAAFLNTHQQVEKVNYNGLETHPDYALVKKQMRRPGAILSFELKGGFDAAVKFINRLQLCVKAVSLGTTDTLVSHPASMSHLGMTPEQRAAAGVSDGLIRMSVGLENINDLISDIQQALNS